MKVTIDALVALKFVIGFVAATVVYQLVLRWGPAGAEHVLGVTAFVVLIVYLFVIGRRQRAQDAKQRAEDARPES